MPSPLSVDVSEGAAITCTYQWANVSASNSLLVTNASLSKIR